MSPPTGTTGWATDVFLETERLLLRRFSEADLDNLVDWNSDPEVKRYVSSCLPDAA
jgi:RimJ/RimL family protein N-acetyltransferase